MSAFFILSVDQHSIPESTIGVSFRYVGIENSLDNHLFPLAGIILRTVIDLVQFEFYSLSTAGRCILNNAGIIVNAALFYDPGACIVNTSENDFHFSFIGGQGLWDTRFRDKGDWDTRDGSDCPGPPPLTQRFCPVRLSGQARTLAGVPLTTMVPPSAPPPGPMSMI